MIYEKAGVSVAGMAVAPFIQLPVTLGMFFGVKKLCDLPLEQLKYGGFAWVPDLTVADPTWALPIIATVLMNVQISVCPRVLLTRVHVRSCCPSRCRCATWSARLLKWATS